MYKIKESGTITFQENTRIAGIALLPQISRNGVFYTLSVLKANDGRTVPLFVNHETEGNRPIGEATFKYSDEKLALTYTAVITDPDYAELVKENTWKVSIGGTAEGDVVVECDREEKNCYQVPEMVTINELSILEPEIPAGIPSSTVEVIECKKCKYHGDECDCDKCKENTSNKDIKTTKKLMTDKTLKKEEVKEAVEEAEVCVKADTPVEVTPVETPQKSDEVNSYVSKEDFESAISKIGELIAGIQKPVAQAPKEDVVAKVKVAPEVTQEIAKSQSELVREALKTTGIHTIEVDIEDYITKQSHYNEKLKVTEAFSVTGGSPTTGEFPATAGSNQTDNALVIRPSAESFIPVRQWLDTRVLPTGVTETVWYYMDSSLTAGFDTARNATGITDSTLPQQNKTISNLKLAVTTQIGFRTILNATDLEDSKFDLAGAFREIAARRKLESELKSVLTTLRGAPHGAIASGATAGANTADKAKIFRTASTTGVTNLKIADVLNIVEYFKEESYDGWANTSGITPVMLCSIATWKELFSEAINDAEYSQFFRGSNQVTGKVQFEAIFGITIVPTREVSTATSGTNTASSVFCFLPRYSIAMATKRELTIKFQEETTQLLTNVTVSWRDAYGVIDAHSIVRYDVTTTAGAIAAT